VIHPAQIEVDVEPDAQLVGSDVIDGFRLHAEAPS
jgi:hypothetical protein